jgi:hypothetical protein
MEKVINTKENNNQDSKGYYSTFIKQIKSINPSCTYCGGVGYFVGFGETQNCPSCADFCKGKKNILKDDRQDS